MMDALRDKFENQYADKLNKIPKQNREKVRQELWNLFQELFSKSLFDNLIEEYMAGTIFTNNYTIKIEHSDLSVNIMKYNLNNQNVNAASFRVILVTYSPDQNHNRQWQEVTMTDNQFNAEQTDGQMAEAIKQAIQPAVSKAIHQAFHDAARQAIQSLPDGLETGSRQTDNPAW